jgi:hypothetical protein
MAVEKKTKNSCCIEVDTSNKYPTPYSQHLVEGVRLGMETMEAAAEGMRTEFSSHSREGIREVED